MNILVLGGCGVQGRAALYDLSRNPLVKRIVCADVQPDLIQNFHFLDFGRIKAIQIDATDHATLVAVMRQDVDGVIDMLPAQFARSAALAAIEAGVSIVNTNYAYPLLDLHEQALDRGVAILPECGLDPGIDLVFYHYGANQFDEINTLNSYCGGIPEKTACTNPLNYKISWNWDMVLKTQKRDSVMISNHQEIHIPAVHQHDNSFVHDIDFPGLGKLEAFPNGNAAHFLKLLGIAGTVEQSGRYTLRWPGWCNFWATLKTLGFLDDTPVPGLLCDVTPHEFLVRMMEPRLQYQPQEKDLAVMQNVLIGKKNGRMKKLTGTVRIERDLSTGLMGMALGVSYPACIATEMIATGQISEKGVISPITHIPPEPFFDQLNRRGIQIEIVSEDRF
jgi:saccharopine dehydrogenase-like NADP-dependent oxidoreductase